MSHVEVKGVLSESDFDNVVAMATEKPVWRRVIALVWYAWIGLLAAVNTYYLATGAREWSATTVVWAAILVTVALRVGLPRFLRGSLRRRFRDGRPVHLELTEDGIHDQREHGVTFIPWERISRWRQRDHVIALYIKLSSALMVPTRALSPSERNVMRELLVRKVGSAT